MEGPSGTLVALDSRLMDALALTRENSDSSAEGHRARRFRHRLISVLG
jgi:hypothetical protein